jgi:AcrR family transcriptional regulator
MGDGVPVPDSIRNPGSVCQMTATPVPDVVQRAQRADAVRNHAKVLAAARASFAVHGGEAPIEDIARRAGVGVGTIYRHFPTKQDLIDALVVEHFSDVIERTEVALGDEDPGAAFFDVLEYCYEAQSRDRMFDVLNDVAAGSEAKAKIIEELCVVLDRLIDRARDAGAVRPELCADDIGVIMCGLAAAKRSEAWYRGEDPAGRYFRYVLDGLRPPAPQR